MPRWNKGPRSAIMDKRHRRCHGVGGELLAMTYQSTYPARTVRLTMPSYRADALQRRADTLAEALAGRGRLLLVSRSGRRLEWEDRPSAPKRCVAMEDVTITDDVMADGFSLLAMIDSADARAYPLTDDDSLLPLATDMLDAWEARYLTVRNGRHLYGSPDYDPVVGGRHGSDVQAYLQSTGLFDREASCDRCKRNAQGRMTYLVRDEESFEVLTVCGRCIHRYAGGLPAGLVRRYASLMSFATVWSSNRAPELLPAAASYVPFASLMHDALGEMLRVGYGSVRDLGIRSTVGSIMHQATYNLESHSIRLAAEAMRPIIEWARSGMDGVPADEWRDRAVAFVRDLPDDGMIRISDTAYPVSIAMAWYHHIETRDALFLSRVACDGGAGSPIGEPGERIRVSVVGIRHLRRDKWLARGHYLGEWRDTYLLVADDGRLLMWNTQKPVPWDASIEGPLEFVATVSRHIEYMGHVSTVVSRGTFPEWDAARTELERRRDEGAMAGIDQEPYKQWHDSVPRLVGDIPAPLVADEITGLFVPR